jgi:hypothetical protein
MYLLDREKNDDNGEKYSIFSMLVQTSGRQQKYHHPQ